MADPTAVDGSATPPNRTLASLAVLFALALVGTIWASPAGGRSAAVGAGGRDDDRRLTVPILIYHGFQAGEPTPDTFDYQISTRRFDAQLRMLRVRGWRAITAADLAILLAQGAAPPKRTFVITIDDGLRDGLTEAFPVLRRHGFVATYFVVTGKLGSPDYLTWDEARALRDAGMEIASHTATHARLGDESPDRVATEVRDAQRTIARELGDPPLTFSYPGGSFNEVAVEAVRDAGLLAAFTTQAGNTFSWSSRLTIPRLNVNGDWTPQLLLRYLRSAT